MADTAFPHGISKHLKSTCVDRCKYVSSIWFKIVPCLGNPVPEAKWVLRGRIVNNNTSPSGSNNQIYLIHELGKQSNLK